MNKTRHVVAMRFCVSGLPNRFKPMSPEYIERTASLCNKITVKSLLNMKNKNFESVFLVNNTADLTLLGPLVPIAADLNATIIRMCDFQKFCSKLNNDSDLIVSRCDADDAYANWVVDDIQEQALKTSAPIVYGYDDMLYYRFGTNIIRESIRKYPVGHRGAFQTVIYKKDSELLKGFNPYSWNHANMFSNEEFKSHIAGLDKKNVIKRSGSKTHAYPCGIWIRDGKNSSVQSLEYEEQLPEVNISKTEVKDIYGVDLLP